MAPLRTRHGLQGWADIAPSPDGKLLYYSYYTGTAYGVKQMQVATLQTRDLGMSAPTGIKPGPDGLIYMAEAGAASLDCVNSPNTFNTASLNECGLNKFSVPLGPAHAVAVYGGLPNMALQCTGSAMPAQFSYTVTNCLTVNFHATNCAGPYSWNFGDLGVGSGQNISHTYAAAGTYTVTLTVAGASPATSVQSITVGLLPVTLAGPATTCAKPSNYSAVGPPNYSYSWSITGGTPATWTGNNVDVVWGAGNGAVTLLVTDSTTGCTAHYVQPVAACPSCYPPPLNMTAWWPLDEPSGTVATETVVGNNGADINAPAHVGGKVKRARSFSGVNDYVRVNDASQINFGTGDFTVDAWVRTTVATGIQPIVDKRIADPEWGYMLYIKNGRLALRIGDGTVATGTEFWSPTTPLVADGLWHHVAGVEKRAATGTGTRLYVDGVPVASFTNWPLTSNITNTAKLTIGAWAPGIGFLNYFTGQIDEVEIFQRALGTTEIQGIFAADTVGKCKEFCYVPTSANFCRDANSIILTMNVCNYSTAAQTYSLVFSGLTAGGSCTWAGPSVIQVLGSNPVTVPANSCVPVQYKVFRPTGMPQYTTTCYQVTMTNIGTGKQSICGGSIYASRAWCNILIGPPIGIGGLGGTAKLSYKLTNTSGGPLSTPYTVRVIPADPSLPELPGVSLNGLDPGVSYQGVASLANGDSMQVDMFAAFTQPRAFRFYDVVLSMDENGDGLDDAQAAGGLMYAESLGSTPVYTPPTSLPRRLALSVAPNPVNRIATIHYELPVGGQAEVALYDIVGRNIRTLLKGSRPPGAGNLLLDCQKLPRGVYFLRLKLGEGSKAQRLVVVN